MEQVHNTEFFVKYAKKYTQYVSIKMLIAAKHRLFLKTIPTS